MRVFDVIKMRRQPRYSYGPSSIIPPVEKVCIIVKNDDGEGWEIFTEVDGLAEGQLIAKALNAPEMQESVEEAQKVSQFEAALELFGHQLSSIDARLQALEDA